MGRPVVDLLTQAKLAPVAMTITGGAAVTDQAERAYGVPKSDLVMALLVALQAGRLKIASELPEAAADVPAAPLAGSFTTPTATPVVQTARAAAWAATITATIAQPTSSPMPPGPTPIRTPVPLPAKPTVALVQAKPTAVGARTSGLGRSRADWEQTFGPPDTNGAYANGSLRAGFENDRLVQLERIVGAGEPKTSDFVTGTLAALLPADTVPLRPITLGDTVRGECYRSASLVAAVYGAAATSSDERADFFVFYQLDATGGVASAIVSIGTFP